MVYNGTNTNWSMFRYDLTHSSFTGTRNVVLTSRAGTDSFDEDDGETANSDQRDDTCAVCHINDSNATTMVRQCHVRQSSHV